MFIEDYKILTTDELSIKYKVIKKTIYKWINKIKNNTFIK